MEVVARIQGHPARAHLHQELAASIGLPTETRLHSSDPPNPWCGYRNCLRDIPACSHLVLIQDDAVVCRNFSEAVKQVAASNPDTPVVLFLAHQPRRTALFATRAMKARQRYVDLFIRDFCPVVGMLWPREKALQFLDWTEKGKLPGGEGARSDDAVVGRWMLTNRERIRATVPSLVEHPGIEPSVKGSKNASSRFTALFFAEDGLHYEW